MQRQRGELLAGARFAGQQHRAVRPPATRCSAACSPLICKRAAHQAIGRAACVGRCVRRSTQFSRSSDARSRPLSDRIEDLRHAERLEDEVAGAGAQRLDRGVKVGEGGDQHHLACIALLAQFAQPCDAALAGQIDVEDHEVEAVTPAPARLPPRRCRRPAHDRPAAAASSRGSCACPARRRRPARPREASASIARSGGVGRVDHGWMSLYPILG